jgi:hypothetical protein
MIAPGFTPTKGRTPPTGERQLEIQFRTGAVSKWTYTAKQIRWTDTGDSHDVIAVRLV